MAAPMLIINSLFVTLITLQHCFTFLTQSEAASTSHNNPINSPSPSSLVLGLTPSKSTLPLASPKTPYKPTAAITSTQTLDMMEPLRGIRDGYLIPLNLGTPPQLVQVYMDTGSDLTWVPCGNVTFDCIDCDVSIPKTFGNFSPSLSSTAYRDLCGSRFCSDIHSSDNSLDPCTISGCSLPTLLKSTCPRPCPSFAYTYGAGGAVTGALTRDTLHVHVSSNMTNTSTREVPKFCFGCVGASYREPIGIAGFGRGPLSLPSQLGFGRKGFSHCFLPFKYANTPNAFSPLLVGEAALSYREGMQFTPMLNSPMYPNYYYVGLEAVTVAESTMVVPTSSLRELDPEGNGGMLMDSGTTYTHLPEPFYSDILSTLGSVIGYPRAAEVESETGFDLCYRVAAAEAVGFPAVTFHFLNNVSVVVGEENLFYAMAAASNGTVVKCMLMQSMEEEGEEGPAGVFGSFQQQNLDVVYDLGNQRIGFRGMDCASLNMKSEEGGK